MQGNENFQVEGPIDAQRAQAAAEWMIHNAVRIGRTKGGRDMCENMLRVVKALEMKASDEKSAAAQERDAYASDNYKTALEDLFDATVAHQTLLSTSHAAQAVIEIWRSLNSTLKASRV